MTEPIDVVAPVVHGESTPTPETEPITFDERQQRFIDSVLIPKTMGRAAKDVRAELAATKTQLANAEAALKASSPESSETERLRAELQLARAESEAVKTAAAEATRASDIERELTRAGVLDPPLLRAAISDRVQRQGNDYQILDDSGAIREGVSLKQFVEEEAGKRPYLVKGTVIPGAGARGSSGSIPPPQIPLEHYFGPKSNAAAVNKLSLQRPDEYQRLRREAVRKGLI